MAYGFMTQAVLSSVLCFQRDADSFFSPETLQHTGFAFDGSYYVNGVATPGRIASWYSEQESITRGPLQTFPTQALVLVDRASLSILDASTADLTLWMIFYLADGRAFTNNIQGGPEGYLPGSVSWSNGLLSVVFQPDPGSTAQAPVVITIDFTQDQVYADTRA